MTKPDEPHFGGDPVARLFAERDAARQIRRTPFLDRVWAGRDAAKAPIDGRPTLGEVTGSTEDTTYGLRALAGEIDRLAATPEGGRDDQANTTALKLGRLAGGGELTEATVRDALAGVVESWDYPNGNPFTRSDVDRWMRGGYRDGLLTPRHRGDLDAALEAWLADAPDGPPITAAERDDIPPRIDWHDLWRQPDGVDWIHDPLIPAGRLVALYSAPKVGKSLLMLELAAGIAQGKPVIGYRPTKARRVLYVDFENDPRGDIRTRLQAMGIGPDDLGNLVYLSFPSIAKLDSPLGGVELLATAMHYGCELVVIDTVSRAVGGEENSNDTWLNLYRHTGVLFKNAGIAMVRLDHSGKDAERGQRGGSAKEGDADAIWHLTDEDGDALRLANTHRRFELPPEDQTLILHRRTDPLRHEVDALGTRSLWQADLARRVEALDELGVPDDAGRDRLIKALRDAWGPDARVGSNDLMAAVARARKGRFRLSGTGTGPETCPDDDGQAEDSQPEQDS